jgi:hypothetical protein
MDFNKIMPELAEVADKFEEVFKFSLEESTSGFELAFADGKRLHFINLPASVMRYKNIGLNSTGGMQATYGFYGNLLDFCYLIYILNENMNDSTTFQQFYKLPVKTVQQEAETTRKLLESKLTKMKYDALVTICTNMVFSFHEKI